MMWKKIVIGVLLLIFLGGLYWLFDYKKGAAGPDGMGTVSEVPRGGNQEIPTLPPGPPEGFKNLQETVAMAPDVREKQLTLFNEIITTLEEHPDSPIGWLNLGIVKKAFGDYRGTEEAWLYALSLAPDYTVIYGNLGGLYWQELKNFPRSEWAYLEYIKRDPTAVHIYRDLADLYRHDYKAKSGEVGVILEQALKENQEHPDILSYLAEYYYQTGRRDLAIEYYERLVVAAPGNQQAKEDLEDLRAGRNIGSPE